MRRPKYYIQKNMKIWGDLKEVIIRNTGNHTVWQSGQKQLECERAVHEDDHQTSFSSVWWLKMRISVHGAHTDDQHRLQIEKHNYCTCPWFIFEVCDEKKMKTFLEFLSTLLWLSWVSTSNCLLCWDQMPLGKYFCMKWWSGFMCD